MRRGIFGGTFDPIHVGHLEIANRTQGLFGLDEIYFVVSSAPPHKNPHGITSAFHRFAMCAIAVNDNPDLKLSTIELENSTSPYTIDTLNRFKVLYGGKDDFLFLMLGGDSFASLKSWKDSLELIEQHNLIVVERPAVTLESTIKYYSTTFSNQIVDLRGLDVSTIEKVIADGEKQGTPKTYVVNLGSYPISASEVRSRIKRDLPVDDLVPSGVLTYIRKQELYRD